MSARPPTKRRKPRERGQCTARYSVGGEILFCVLEVRHEGPHVDVNGRWGKR